MVGPPVIDLAAALPLGDAPPAEVARGAAAFLEHGVGHVVLQPDLAEDTERALEVATHGADALFSLATVDPRAPGARAAAARWLDAGARGLVLHPAVLGCRASSSEAEPLLRLAAERCVPVVVHCGLVPARLRDRLPADHPIDLHAGDPLDVALAATRFPGVPFVVPRFGGGLLREVLLAGETAENLHVDSSSDHVWRRVQERDAGFVDALARVLGVFGPERVLFATGSTLGAAGWRHERFAHLREALGALDVAPADHAAILGGNALRLLASR